MVFIGFTLALCASVDCCIPHSFHLLGLPIVPYEQVLSLHKVFLNLNHQDEGLPYYPIIPH